MFVAVILIGTPVYIFQQLTGTGPKATAPTAPGTPTTGTVRSKLTDAGFTVENGTVPNTDVGHPTGSLVVGSVHIVIYAAPDDAAAGATALRRVRARHPSSGEVTQRGTLTFWLGFRHPVSHLDRLEFPAIVRAASEP